jgi:HJR/Mrr/RecB family endonuclease
MIEWFKSNSGLAVDILKRAIDYGNLFWIFIAAGFFFGWLFVVVPAGLVIVAFGLLSWWASWAPCPHGVPRGKTENSCQTCVREQNEIEEARRRERELKERQQRIDAAADRLRDSERLRLAKSLVPNIEELRGLSWQQFEDEVARMFGRMGFTVEQTPYVNDHGRDAILRKDGKKSLLECKKYADGNVSGRPDLQKFHSAMITDGAVSGFFVTAGGFTKEAIEFAAKVRMELIDQHNLVRMMFDSKPDAAEDDSYRSMCKKCEDIVSHRLRTPRTARCRNRHEVAPTLDFESLLPASARPRKTRRGRDFEKPKGYAIDATTDEGQKKLAAILGAGLETAREAIVGNTYPVKDQLRALGGRWNPDQKAWMVPADKAEEAKSLANGLSFGAAPKLPPSKNSGESGGRGDLPTTLSGVTRKGIRPGDRIVIRYLDDNKTATLTLSDERNDPANGVLSVASPLGKQVIGLVEGDETELEVAGRLRPVLIISVEPGALGLSLSHANSLPSVRFRVGDYEFRQADYRQILLWAKALESTPTKIVGTFRNTTVVVTYVVDGGDVVQAGKIAFKVEDGSITSLAWDCDELPLSEFSWVEDLKIREIAFIGWHVRLLPRFSCDLSSLRKLVFLEVGMRELNLSSFTHLTHLYCSENELTELDLTCIPELVELNCSRNELIELDLSMVPKLEKLRCGENPLAELDLSNVTELCELECSCSKITSLDLTNVPKLVYLHCWDNPLMELDISNVPELADLCCTGNQLAALNLSNVPKLYELICDCNDLTELDLSNAAALAKLSCGANQLTELDLSNVPRLTALHCRGNVLTELDVSKVPRLTNLDCGDNELIELDLSNLPELAELDCCGNQITELDVRQNRKLIVLKCDPSVSIKKLPSQVFPAQTDSASGRIEPPRWTDKTGTAFD